jgi:hypothetical protein
MAIANKTKASQMGFMRGIVSPMAEYFNNTHVP